MSYHAPALSRSLDASRLAQAVQASGVPVDPRIWLVVGVIDGEPFEDTDVPGSVLYPVIVAHNDMPSVAEYCGACGIQNGVHWPCDQGDVVLMALPYGSERPGLKILARWWSPATPAPDILNHPLEPTVVTPPGDTTRVITQGGPVKVFERGLEEQADVLAKVQEINVELAKIREAIQIIQTHVHGPPGSPMLPPVPAGASFDPAVPPVAPPQAVADYGAWVSNPITGLPTPADVTGTVDLLAR